MNRYGIGGFLSSTHSLSSKNRSRLEGTFCLFLLAKETCKKVSGRQVRPLSHGSLAGGNCELPKQCRSLPGTRRLRRRNSIVSNGCSTCCRSRRSEAVFDQLQRIKATCVPRCPISQCLHQVSSPKRFSWQHCFLLLPVFPSKEVVVFHSLRQGRGERKAALRPALFLWAVADVFQSLFAAARFTESNPVRRPLSRTGEPAIETFPIVPRTVREQPSH